MTERTFNVPSISCQHCVNTIRMELSELQGVENVTPDANEKNVRVIFNEPATEQSIIDLLEEINYPVES